MTYDDGARVEVRDIKQINYIFKSGNTDGMLAEFELKDGRVITLKNISDMRQVFKR